MDLDVFILSEECQTENDKYHVIYVNSKKIYTSELIHKTETDSQT